jgi:predicted cobalt transporter CbtA
MLSARTLLVRGLLAGLFAGLVAFGVAYVVGEPSINAAIALEESAAHAHPEPGPAPDEHSVHEHGDEAEVPRSLQATAGLLTATLTAGAALGGLVGVLSALALGRLGWLSPRASTLAVTAIGFVALYAVPFAIYPPNPPAVGSADTIGLRTALYFTAMAISVIAAVAAVLGARHLARRWSGWHAALAGIGGYLLAVGVAFALLPKYNEVPGTFPATVLYEFRTASFVIALTMWAVLGVVLAELVDRVTSRSSAPALVDAAR